MACSTRPSTWVKASPTSAAASTRTPRAELQASKRLHGLRWHVLMRCDEELAIDSAGESGAEEEQQQGGEEEAEEGARVREVNVGLATEGLKVANGKKPTKLDNIAGHDHPNA